MNRVTYKACHLSLTATAILGLSLLMQSCQRTASPFSDQTLPSVSSRAFKDPKSIKDFIQVNLVANTGSYGAAHIDPHLKNAWGIAFSGNGIAWVGSQEGHVSAVYDREGNFIPARPEVAIPSPAGPVATNPTGGNPTGVVLNIDPNAGDFLLSNGKAARFMFVGVDGIISGWNPDAGNFALTIKNNVSTSAYTGLTMAKTTAGAYYLYAADFRAGRIAVFDKDFNSVDLSFTDADLPEGYAPFNIQNVDGKLYVMYAKVGDDGEEDASPGNGYVDVYDLNGSLQMRFVSRGQLNAPWGVAHAPASFFTDESDFDWQSGRRTYQCV